MSLPRRQSPHKLPIDNSKCVCACVCVLLHVSKQFDAYVENILRKAVSFSFILKKLPGGKSREVDFSILSESSGFH